MNMRAALLGLALSMSHGTAFGYQVETHYDIASAAVQKSDLMRNPNLIPALGIAGMEQAFYTTDGLNLDNFTDECAHGVPLSVQFLIACGAQFEDHPFPRVFNHFYDPVYERPLTVGIALGETSSDWSLAVPGTFISQENSYGDARDYFFSALIYNDTNARDAALARQRYWGRVFQTLGQVIHHLQDMTQPQHVRNDDHIVGIEPSHYEGYTANKRSDLLSIVSGQGSEPVVLGSPGALRTPRDFWENDAGTGVAEFTNRNFLSKNTNWEINNNQQVTTTEYAQPEWIGIVENIDVTELTPPVSQQVLDYCQGRSATCTMSFYSSVHDVENPRASTLSIFDQYVELREVTYRKSTQVSVNRIFTLNRYNFETV